MKIPPPRLPAAILVVFLALALPAPGWAQDRVPEAGAPEAGQPETPIWRFTFTPQLWMSGLSGTIGIGGLVSEVDLSFSEVFEDFDIGVVGLFEARRHPWVIRADLYYASRADERALSADGSGTLRAEQKQFMVQPEIGYAVLSRPWGGVDALVGARYWHLSVDLDAPPQALSGDRGWIDGTVGALVRYQPAERWHLFAKTDAGAGGSDFTWQALGGVGYDLSRCCTLDAIYRHLAVDYQKDDVVYDVQHSGPAAGVTLHF